jgi:5-epi-alpha-selinene synthase
MRVGSGAGYTAFNSAATESPDQAASRIEELVKIAIRELPAPFEQQSNPFARDAQKFTIDWINKYNVITDPAKIRKIYVSNFGDLMGKAHPRAGLKTLSFVADFVTWLFIYDDMIEKCRDKREIQKLHDRTITIISGGKSNESDSPLTHGLYNIVKKINNECRSSLWKNRFIQDVRDYCEATQWELLNRERKKIPSLKEYQRMRPDTSGTKIMFDFIEIVERINIPKDIFDGWYLQKIRLLGANLVNWENDLLSAHKEFLNEDIHNLIFVYKNECKSSYETAFQRTIADLTGDLAKFQELSEQVPDFGLHTEEVKKYILGIKEWIAAHHFWAKESPRYINYFTDAG